MADLHILLMRLSSGGWYQTQPGEAEYWFTTQLEANGGRLVSFMRTIGPYDLVATVELDSAKAPGFAQWLADEIGGEPLMMRAFSSKSFHEGIAGWVMVPIKNSEPRQGP
jgi:uncharacterized protein with GYD domain